MNAILSVAVMAAAASTAASTAAAGPATAGCSFVVLAEAGLTVLDDGGCEEGRLGAATRLSLAPAGFVHLQEGGRTRVCTNLDEHAVVFSVGGEPAGLLCHGAAATRGEPVLVLDLEPGDVTPATAQIVTSLVAVGASRQRGLDVVSGRELVRLLREGEVDARQGCSDDESCLADLAGALGARYVVAGKVTQVGALLAVDLRLLDSEAAAVLARAEVRARDLGGVGQRLGPALNNLLGPLTGLPPVEVPPPPPSRAPDDLATALGALVAGGLGAAGLLACVAAPTFLMAGAAVLLLATAMAIVPTGVVGTPLCGLLCAPLGAAGAAVGAEAGDRLFGYDSHWLRTSAVAGVGALGGVAMLSSMTLLAVVLVSAMSGIREIAALGPAAVRTAEWTALAVGTGGGLVASTLLTAGAAAVTFVVMAVLLQPEDPLTPSWSPGDPASDSYMGDDGREPSSRPSRSVRPRDSRRSW